MKLSLWLPTHIDLLRQAHEAWSRDLPDWSELVMRRYGPRGTAMYLFGDLNELQRKEVVISVLDDFLRTGQQLNFGAVDSFIAQAVKKAPPPPPYRPPPKQYEPEPEEDDYDAQVQAEGMRLMKEALGVFPDCACRRTGGALKPIRVKADDCVLDHSWTDGSYRSLRERARNFNLTTSPEDRGMLEPQPEEEGCE